ncbi:hypothetical protein ACO2Q3_01595 [Caulobacter sp. KR2-114]|uniref:hypothetical protein n=1 Tax=Caulobacter sp. KR2-114 TaxID=3400912 RepID=UPI003C03D4FE
MSDMRNRQVRATEYRRLADVAGALAEASPLAHVREKHARAAASWAALAQISEHATEDLRLRTEQARSLLPSHEDTPCTA